MKRPLLHQDPFGPPCDALDTILANALGGLADAQVDQLADERTRLTAQIADLDKKIRAVGAQVVAGVLHQEDAIAMNAPLIAQRDLAKLPAV